MKNRIYFVGAHSTGKTTMARWVSNTYKLPMITEVARAILAELESDLNSIQTDMDTVARYQKKIFERQLKTEYSLEKGFVSDRAFDNLAYAAEHSTALWEILSSQTEEIEQYMQWVNNGIIFFIRPQKSLLCNDGVRVGVNWASVLRIDGMIKLMLEQHNCSYLPINSCNMQERVRSVEFVMGKPK